MIRSAAASVAAVALLFGCGLFPLGHSPPVPATERPVEKRAEAPVPSPIDWQAIAVVTAEGAWHARHCPRDGGCPCRCGRPREADAEPKAEGAGERIRFINANFQEPPEPVPPTPEVEPTPAASEDLVSISGPEKVAAGGYFILSVKFPPAAPNVLTDFQDAVPPDCPPPVELLAKTPGESLYLYQQVPRGVYRFTASAQVSVDKAEGFDPHDHDEHIVTVGGPAPKPDPDDDTDPDDDPDDTDPTPDAAPFPAKGLTVLIVYETKDARNLPEGQRALLFGKANRDLLDAKTVLGPDGKTREWRIYDADTDVSAESETWQKAMAVPRPSLPALVVSNGKTGFVGPLPADPAAFAEIINRLAE